MKTIWGATLGGLLACAGTANAAPQYGDTVTCSGYYACSSRQAIVGDGAEFMLDLPDGRPAISVDFGDDGVTFTNMVSGFGLSGVQYFADLDAPFGRYDIVSQSGMSKFGRHRLAVQDGVLQLLTGAIFGEGGTYTLRLDAASAVPEPTAWVMMMMIGVGAIGRALRRRTIAVRICGAA